MLCFCFAGNQTAELTIHFAAPINLSATMENIQNNLDVKIKENGESELHLAAAQNMKISVMGLVKMGANIDALSPSASGESVLHIAARKGFEEMVQILIDNKADLNLRRTEDGLPPIFTAYLNNQYSILKQLIKHGADVNVKVKYNDNGDLEETLLHVATYEGRKNAVKILVENGANIHVKDSAFETVMHVVAETNYVEIANFLIENGSKIHERDHNGEIPLLGQWKKITCKWLNS